MAEINRRDALRIGYVPLVVLLLGGFLDGGVRARAQNTAGVELEARCTAAVHYLEIVTPNVDAICRTYEQLHGVTFGEPDASLGNARTAQMANGSLLGVRAPLRKTEQPVVRPYLLVEDIKASVAKAAASGAEVALPPMKLQGHGTCAIVIQGGIEHGLWQVEGASE